MLVNPQHYNFIFMYCHKHLKENLYITYQLDVAI